MPPKSSKRALSELDINVTSLAKKTRTDKPISKPSDYNKLTVKELQDTLRSRLIYKKGNKSQLVLRLQQDDRAEEREGLQEKDKSVIAERKYEELKIPSLKAELEARELKVGGTKAELVERLHQNDRDQVHQGEQDNLFDDEVKRDEKEAGLDYEKKAGAMLKDPLPDYDKMPMSEIKEKLREKGLLLKGDSQEVRARLKQADLESTVEYKQIMERDARKRRERFVAAREKKGIVESHDDEFSRHFKKYDLVRKRGPKAKPLFDDWGYPLSYEKLANQTNSFNRSLAASERMMAHYEQKDREKEEKIAIMGLAPRGRGDLDSDLDWVVAKDLEIPAHTVEVSDFKEWKKRGFEATEERVKEVEKEDQDLMMKMMEGSAFRVGYRR